MFKNKNISYKNDGLFSPKKLSPKQIKFKKRLIIAGISVFIILISFIPISYFLLSKSPHKVEFLDEIFMFKIFVNGYLFYIWPWDIVNFIASNGCNNNVSSVSLFIRHNLFWISTILVAIYFFVAYKIMRWVRNVVRRDYLQMLIAFFIVFLFLNILSVIIADFIGQWGIFSVKSTSFILLASIVPLTIAGIFNIIHICKNKTGKFVVYDFRFIITGFLFYIISLII